MIQFRVNSNGQVQGSKLFRLVRGDRLKVEVVWLGLKGALIKRPWEAVTFGASVPGVFSGELAVVCDEWSDGVNDFGDVVSRGTLRLDADVLKAAIGDDYEVELHAELQFEDLDRQEVVTSQQLCLVVRNDVIKSYVDDDGEEEPDFRGMVEPGDVLWHYGPMSTIPEDRLACFGATLLIADYPEVFARIGTTWGGDGARTFQLPNFLNSSGKGRVVRAHSDAVPVGTYQNDAMQRINGYLVSVHYPGFVTLSQEAALYWENYHYVYGLNPVSGGSTGMNVANIGFDSSRIARTSDETRMASLSAIPVMFMGR